MSWPLAPGGARVAGERTDWVAANATERAMADALAGGDPAQYAELLLAATLYALDAPEPDTAHAERVTALLPPDAPYVLAFTSPGTAAHALGEHVPGCQELDFAALRQRWPSPRHRLAVNPGSPIGVFLPPQAADRLAAGTQSLVAIEDVRQAIADWALTQIREACLRELAGGGDPERYGDPVANDLETTLRDAVAREDGAGFLHTLLAAEVILPVTAPVSRPGQIYEEGEFPWLVVGHEHAPSIPMFASAEALARAGSGRAPEHQQLAFIDVIACWPDEAYALCFNPGTATELILPGRMVRDLVAELAEALPERSP